jgi:hypothetical protein
MAAVGIARRILRVPLAAITLGRAVTGRSKGVPKGVGGLSSNNVRTEEGGNFDFTSGEDKALLTSIVNSGDIGGIHTPPIVHINEVAEVDANGVMIVEPETVDILQGNRRLRAAMHLRDTDSAVFSQVFPDGCVTCVVCEGILTDEQRWAIVADHAYMKRLKPVEQYYTVSKFYAFGWKQEMITNRITGSKALTEKMLRILAIGESATSVGLKLYAMCIASLRGDEGAKTVPLGAIHAAGSIIRKAKGDGNVEAEGVCTLKGAYEGKTLSEILDMVQSGDVGAGSAALRRLRAIGEVKARFESAVDDVERDVLGWVLQLDGFDWTATATAE